MCNHHQRNPLHCILPPYMADKLGQLTGTDADQLRADNRIRTKRKLLAAVPPKKKKEATPVSAKAKTKLYREVYDAGQMPMAIGKLIWKEGQKMIKGDKDAKNVIEGA